VAQDGGALQYASAEVQAEHRHRAFVQSGGWQEQVRGVAANSATVIEVNWHARGAGDEAVRQLASALAGNTHLRRIVLSNMLVNDSSARLLEVAMSDSAVEEVALEGTSVSAEVAAAIEVRCAANRGGNLSRIDSTARRQLPAYWRGRHSEMPLHTASGVSLLARFLVPLVQLDGVEQAGGRCIYRSMRALLGYEVADATGFVVDMALAEGKTTGDRFAGLQVVAASYNWEGPQLPSGLLRPRHIAAATREVTMPANNEWFVRYCEHHQVLGWLDYLDHDFGDAALLGGVLSEMGTIYSTFRVVPQYLLEPLKTSKAMTRGWIFQESAFTAMDAAVLEGYSVYMDQLGAWLSGGPMPTWASSRDDIATAMEGFSRLYERRCCSLITGHKQAFGKTVANIRSDVPSTRCLAIPLVKRDFNLFVREFRASADPRPFSVVPTYDKYGENVAGTVLDAFGSLEFTQEDDCVVGTLSQIALQHFGDTLQKHDYAAAQGLLRFLWEHQLDTMQRHVLADIKRTMPALRPAGSVRCICGSTSLAAMPLR
jgi:hypothetical protein